MTIHLPEFIDECVDSLDPLAILLMREGAEEEAHILHQQHMSGAQQIIERSIIEQRPHEEDEYAQVQQARVRRISKH